jgi:hypothetical protein
VNLKKNIYNVNNNYVYINRVNNMIRKIIISRYNEDISWIKEYPYDYIVYNKGEK